mgnify:CR=1 FL=1
MPSRWTSAMRATLGGHRTMGCALSLSYPVSASAFTPHKTISLKRSSPTLNSSAASTSRGGVMRRFLPHCKISSIDNQLRREQTMRWMLSSKRQMRRGTIIAQWATCAVKISNKTWFPTSTTWFIRRSTPWQPNWWVRNREVICRQQLKSWSFLTSSFWPTWTLGSQYRQLPVKNSLRIRRDGHLT